MAGLTVIYVDTLFLLNAIVDYLLLLCSARLAGERLSPAPLRPGGAAGRALCGGALSARLRVPGAAPLPGCRRRC